MRKYTFSKSIPKCIKFITFNKILQTDYVKEACLKYLQTDIKKENKQHVYAT